MRAAERIGKCFTQGGDLAAIVACNGRMAAKWPFSCPAPLPVMLIIDRNRASVIAHLPQVIEARVANLGLRTARMVSGLALCELLPSRKQPSQPALIMTAGVVAFGNRARR